MDQLSKTEFKPADKAATDLRARRSRRRIVLVAGAALLAFALVGAYVLHSRTAEAPQSGQGGQRGGGRPGGFNGPVPVVAATVATGDMPVIFNALGTVTPLQTVTVRTQISGQLLEIGFKEGQFVQKGDFLAQIDSRPYQAALGQVEGQLMRDQALLKNAQTDLARYRKLVAEDSIARQTLDTQEALVQQYQGVVRADQSQVETAKLNLNYCRIVAPLSGRVGLRQIDQGNYIQVGDTNGIVVISQEKPITVVFTLPEDDLPAIVEQLRKGATLPVVAFDRANTVKLATGTLAMLDNQIDTSTGTIKLKAEFANDDQSLFPNQFVNAQLQVDVLHGATLMPSAAIQRGAQGIFVYVIKDDGTVTVRPVKLGPSDGVNVAVQSGLQVGERLVVDGADKLREGAQVTVPDPAQAQPGVPADGQQRRHRRDQ
jgi:multidrug efflux system membrane fusion protein